MLIVHFTYVDTQTFYLVWYKTLNTYALKLTALNKEMLVTACFLITKLEVLFKHEI